jgi:hypothetical protein
MKPLLFSFIIIIQVTLAQAALAADCSPTPRMPYEQSRAIKQSMLPPGHLLSEYELDHRIPLCMGGSNDRSNLQLQTWPDAKRKDDDEIALCELVQRGVLTCDEAQETMREWKPQ